MADTDNEHDLALAKKLLEILREKPGSRLDALAANTRETETRVAAILDEYAVAEDGSISWVGPGAGGPWITDAQRNKIVTAG